MKARLIHDGKSFTGHIEDEATYEKVKSGELSWKHSENITHYKIPAEVFKRLLVLDKWVDEHKKGEKL